MQDTTIKEMKVSQSLLKEMSNYMTGKECGLKILAKFMGAMEDKTSDAMLLGQWFEWKATDQLPRNGQEPIPRMLKSGELPMPFKRLEGQLKNYERIIEAYEIDIVHTGYVFQNSPIASGIADIIADWDGTRVIIDIKTTAQIDNRWDAFGWAEEKFENPDSYEAQYLTIQAVQYKYLAKIEWGVENMPFYFFVFSTTDNNSAKIYKVEVDDSRLIKHEEQLKQAYHYFNHKFRWFSSEKLARPNMLKCANCFLKETCTEKIDVPIIKTIHVW
jgi:CRISPR/Cas system-associated exonuclease Cas4 (RecB family)